MSKLNQYVKHKRNDVGNDFLQEHIPLGNVYGPHLFRQPELIPISDVISS